MRPCLKPEGKDRQSPSLQRRNSSSAPPTVLGSALRLGDSGACLQEIVNEVDIVMTWVGSPWWSDWDPHVEAQGLRGRELRTDPTSSSLRPVYQNKDKVKASQTDFVCAGGGACKRQRRAR